MSQHIAMFEMTTVTRFLPRTKLRLTVPVLDYYKPFKLQMDTSVQGVDAVLEINNLKIKWE